MSIQKKLFNYRHLFINPRPVFKAMPPPTEVFMRVFNAIRKRILIIAVLTMLTLVVIGILVPEGTFSVYEDFGITTLTKQPEGFFWDLLWWIRGQPAGYQKPTATGIFAVRKTIGLEDVIGNGFNGPIHPIGLLVEFIVDFVIYVPHFVDPSFVVVNLDLVPGFIIKIIVDVGAMGVFVMIVVPAIAVLFFFAPLVLQRLFLVAGPLLRLLIIAGFLLFVYLLFTGYLDPIFEGLINFLGGQ